MNTSLGGEKISVGGSYGGIGVALLLECLCFRGLGLGVVSGIWGVLSAVEEVDGLVGVTGARFLLLLTLACVIVVLSDAIGVKFVRIRCDEKSVKHKLLKETCVPPSADSVFLLGED